MAAYYNENDPKAAAWLRELIKEKLIAEGEVDERSIQDVDSNDLEGFRQCHFFAGIGGWSYALRLAGWPDDREVWTGSCPCQPLSCAGQRKGHADERHLWPAFYTLIHQRRPAIAFGEQVASKDGREWLAGVRADLEGIGYAVGASDLCAASVGAPHRRQRIYWVANGQSQRRTGRPRMRGSDRRVIAQANSETNIMADLRGEGLQIGEENRKHPDKTSAIISRSDTSMLGNTGCKRDERRRGTANMGCAPKDQQGEAQKRERRGNAITDSGSDREQLGNAASTRRNREIEASESEARNETRLRVPSARSVWSRFEIVQCRDGKARRFEPESFPLADGIPGRVALLRGYGNAIVPQVAAEFIIASEEAISDLRA